MTSAPMRSSASFSSIALPVDLCIALPCSSKTFSYVRTLRYGETSGERHRHEALRVEPQPDLLAHLRDPVGRDTTSPSRRGRAGRRPKGPRTRRWRSRAGIHVSLCQPRVEKWTMPASSQASPTSGMRSTSASHSSQRIGTASIQGRCSSSSCSSPRDRTRLELLARPDHVEVTARRTDRTAAAGRSSACARCSSRPCCAASRPSASCTAAASTRPCRSRRASAAGSPPRR